MEVELWKLLLNFWYINFRDINNQTKQYHKYFYKKLNLLVLDLN